MIGVTQNMVNAQHVPSYVMNIVQNVLRFYLKPAKIAYGFTMVHQFFAAS